MFVGLVKSAQHNESIIGFTHRECTTQRPAPNAQRPTPSAQQLKAQKQLSFQLFPFLPDVAMEDVSATANVLCAQ